MRIPENEKKTANAEPEEENMENVLVFFGGVSCEHDISVITGVMTVNSLRPPYRGIPVYVNREGKWFTGEKLTEV